MSHRQRPSLMLRQMGQPATVHCKVRNRQIPIFEARQLHGDEANKTNYCFACGRHATDFRCMKT